MKRILLSVISLLCLSNSVTALQLQSSNATPSGWFVAGNTGLTFPEITHHHFVRTGTGWPKDHFVYHYIKFSSLLGAEAGYSLTTNMPWLPLISLSGNYTYALSNTVNGRIKQYSLNQFENYNFKYKIQHQTILAILKADLLRWHCFMPFFAVGTGMSFNKTHEYTEEPLPGITARMSPDFNRKTTKAFAYTVGAGIDVITTHNFILGIAYNYGHFGHANTRHGNNGYATEKLPTRLNANTLLISANYYFDNRI